MPADHDGAVLTTGMFFRVRGHADVSFKLCSRPTSELLQLEAAALATHALPASGASMRNETLALPVA